MLWFWRLVIFVDTMELVEFEHVVLDQSYSLVTVNRLLHFNLRVGTANQGLHDQQLELVIIDNEELELFLNCHRIGNRTQEIKVTLMEITESQIAARQSHIPTNSSNGWVHRGVFRVLLDFEFAYKSWFLLHQYLCSNDH